MTTVGEILDFFEDLLSFLERFWGHENYSVSLEFILSPLGVCEIIETFLGP